MTVCEITFIQNPPYKVNFAQFRQDSDPTVLSFHQRIQKTVFSALYLIQSLCIALGKSAYLTLNNAGVSFKHIVLGYYGPLRRFRPPGDVYLAIFKVVFWVLGMACCFASTSYRLFFQQVSPDHSSPYLRAFAHEEIDVGHIKTKELALNTNHVPPEITINDLLRMFDTSNFTDKKKPGYMTLPDSLPRLRTSLETFIRHVNRREAFLGTPPAYDTPRLMAFYQQIEDAVRLSIYKVTSALQTFKEEHGEDNKAYDLNQQRKYQHLLENQGRVALDLAIAGNHCGARYMGEAMSIYYLLHGESLGTDLTLQESLIELLAQKRKEIAQAHIQTDLGVNTHSYNKYMSNMGRLLAIPGTQNIIEHLDNSFNRSDFLVKFFETYTVNSIIDTIQETIKKPNAHLLRSKITDWAKDQVLHWKEKDYADKSREITAAIYDLISSDICNDSSTTKNFQYFNELITHLRKEKVHLPNLENDWNDFLIDLFALKEVKKWCEVQLDQLSEVARNQLQQALPKNLPSHLKDRQLRQIFQANIKGSVSEAVLGKEAVFQLRMALSNQTEIPAQDLRIFLNKKASIHTLGIHLTVDAIWKMLKNETSIESAVQNQLDLDRREEFLSNLSLEEMQTNGLSPQFMEWLLVSQGILLPQEIS